jgi:hypothetical protein
MRTQDAGLERGIISLAVKWHAFQPKQERVPVNERDNLQRNEWIFHGEPQQSMSRVSPGIRSLKSKLNSRLEKGET